MGPVYWYGSMKSSGRWEYDYGKGDKKGTE